MLSRLKITHHSRFAVSSKLPTRIKSFSALAMARTIEKNFQAAIDSSKINGGIICATNSKGDFTYNKALGQRTLLSGEKRPQQLDDVLCLASATKLIASIAALQCVDDGLLTLKGDLSKVAPELAEKQVLTGWSENDEPILEPACQPITLEMLLSHSAGQDAQARDVMEAMLSVFVRREKFRGLEGSLGPVQS
ncbi:hypothetical protein FOC4_g10012118 [Fusarium odoratissimum]|uniref:Beta-lactamase-related domain-containing protein n=1 Tax=Fusarium oxysporum f. sp. cubense (strain race 4) TaxID=2502994 RepID=N1R7M4_FUSC4|nr:hypothetical protein FOC4_g10012118 [Fusarium odoratissimum]